MEEKTNEIFEKCLLIGLIPNCIHCANVIKIGNKIRCSKKIEYKDLEIDKEKNFYVNFCDEFYVTNREIYAMESKAIKEGRGVRVALPRYGWTYIDMEMKNALDKFKKEKAENNSSGKSKR